MAVSRPRRVQIVALLCCALAPSVLVAAGTESAADLEKMHPRANAASLSVPTYSVQVGLDNEIFPAFANFASLQKPQERTWGTVIIKIENPSDVPMHNRVYVTVHGWSDEEIQSVEMAAHEVHTYLFAPTFQPRLYSNHEIIAATVEIKSTDS